MCTCVHAGGRKALLPLTTLTRLNYLFCEDSLTEPQLAQGAHEYNPLELQNLVRLWRCCCQQPASLPAEEHCWHTHIADHALRT